MTVAKLRRTIAVEDLAAEFACTAERHDREASFPFANFARLHAAELLALTVPAQFGGRGAGLAEAARVIRTVAAGEPSTALVLAMQYIQHAMIARSPHFPRHLAEKLGREAVAGISLINALRVEPDLGSPTRGGLPATKAARTPDGWRVSGRKVYSTGAPILRWYLVWCSTDEEEPRVGQFLVPAGLPGIAIDETWDHLGMRATGSHDVLFDNVLIPADHAADVRAPTAWVIEPEQWAWNTLLIGAVYLGVASAAREWLHRFLHERVPTGLGAPLATLPRVQSEVGEIEAQLGMAERLLDTAASEVDRGRPPSVSELGLLKRAVTGGAVAAVEAALALTGNHGLSRRNPLERHYRDVLCSRIHTPQDDAVLLAAGKAALGLA